MKNTFLGLLLFAFSISYSQSFHKKYQTNTQTPLTSIDQENDLLVYGNRIYLLNNDLGFKQLHKLDLSGNVLWSKTYSISASNADLLMVPNNGKIHIMRTGATQAFGVDTLNGTVNYSSYLNPCPPNPQNKSDRHVVLDNGNVIKIGCDIATSKTTIFSINGATGASVSALSITTPTTLGNITSARITKIGPNSILLYGRSSLNLLFFCKITNSTSLANTGIHILKKTLPSSIDADISTSYNGTSDKVIMLFRNGTDFYFIKTDSTLNSFVAYHRPTAGNMVSEITLHQNNLFIASNNVLSEYRSAPLLDKLDLNFNTIQNLQFPVIASKNHPFATSIHQSRTFKVFPTSSHVYISFTEKDSLNSKYIHVIKNNYNEVSTCSSNGISNNYMSIPLIDSLQTSFTASVTNNVLFTSGNVTLNNTISVVPTINCITTNIADAISQETNEIKVATTGSGLFKVISSELITQVSVYSITGGKIAELVHPESNQILLDLSEYSKGVYFVKVNAGFTNKTVKIIYQ